MTDPLLFLPGLMCDARAFLPQMVGLGSGRSVQVGLPVRADSVEAMSAEVLAAAPERFAVIGQGLGGAVALDLVRRAPDRVTRLVLISTDPLAEPPATAAAREARMVAARAGRLKHVMTEEYPDSALADTPWRGDLRALLLDMALNLGEGVFFRQSRALQRRPDQQKTLRRALLPTLVLAGEEDSLIPPRRQEVMAGLLPFAEFQTIAEAGHLPSLEQPEAVTARIDRFLAGPLLLR